MKKIPTTHTQAIKDTSALAATIGFMALASSLLVIQGISRLIMKNF